MKINIALLLLSFMCIVHTHAQTFVINGNGKKFNDQDIIYLTYSKDGKQLLDSTYVKNKTFRFEGTIDQPIKASLYRNENPFLIDISTDSKSIYLEEGTIEIIANKSLNDARAKGTLLNADLERLNKQTRYNRLNSARASKEYEDQADLPASEEKTQLSREAAAAYDRYVLDQLAFAEKNPTSIVSLDILVNATKMSKYADQIALIYTKIPTEVQQSERGQLIAANLEKAKKTLVGDPAPWFMIPDLEGNGVALQDFKGKYILIDFWASWCLPCREENPNLIHVYNRYKDKGLVIIGISLDTKREDLIKAIEEDKLPWLQLADFQGNLSAVRYDYGINTIPANVLIGPDMRILAKDLKGQDLQDRLKEIFGD
ncbi:TlpA disulfide reductase family protein [Sphingobacterium hungaricum]|nr:TlpA disulfide reductase family protein [Sphingobacterium hungaricum]